MTGKSNKDKAKSKVYDLFVFSIEASTPSRLRYSVKIFSGEIKSRVVNYMSRDSWTCGLAVLVPLFGIYEKKEEARAGQRSFFHPLLSS
jgi:hypothetical protein